MGAHCRGSLAKGFCNKGKPSIPEEPILPKDSQFLQQPSFSSEARVDPLPISEILLPHPQVPVNHPTQENATDFYKGKIVQEIKQEPMMPDNQPVEPIDTTPGVIVEEKDKAFVEKKTTLGQKAKMMWQHMKHSFKEVWKDTVYLFKVVYRNGYKVQNYSLAELKLRRSISKDLIRFMPYAVFLIVPGAELVFPLYLLMFPNSTPTQFMTVPNLGERTHHLSDRQEDGYNFLVSSLPKFTKLLDIDPIRLYESLSNLQSSEGREKDRQFYNASDFEERIAAFLEQRNKYTAIQRVALSSLSSFELEQLNKLFYQLYIPGYVWVNVLYGSVFQFPFWILDKVGKYYRWPFYKVFKRNPFYQFSFTLDMGPLAYLKKWLLLYQLKFHLKRIRMQDRILNQNFKELGQLSQIQLIEFSKQRGLKFEEKEEIINYVEKIWLPLSLREDVTDDMLVWITVLRYKYADILV